MANPIATHYFDGIVGCFLPKVKECDGLDAGHPMPDFVADTVKWSIQALKGFPAESRTTSSIVKRTIANLTYNNTVALNAKHV